MRLLLIDFGADANTKEVAIEEIPADWEALDIGPKTAELYRDVIQKSKLVIWNGPMGVFEIDKFANGTKAVAESLAEADTYSIIGGGDSAAAVEKFGLADKMSHISTGGGASLNLWKVKNYQALWH